MSATGSERPQRTDARLSPEALRRKHDVLSHPMPSHVAGIAEAVTIKDRDLFFLSDAGGFVPLTPGHGLGLYYHDCRYLNGYDMQLDGARPEALVASSWQGFRAIFQLTRSEQSMVDESHGARETVEIKLERVVDGQTLTLEDLLEIHNYSSEAVTVQVTMTFDATFDDLFAVRGLLPQLKGQLHPPTWQGTTLVWRYHGLDDVLRGLSVRFEPEPHAVNGATVQFSLNLPSQGSQGLRISFAVQETEQQAVLPQRTAMPNIDQAHSKLERNVQAALSEVTQVETNSILLNSILRQGLRDLGALRSSLHGRTFFSAGIPWFGTLFGRDSLVSAYQMLPFAPRVAAETLQLLADYQGRVFDEWRDEEPGMILHELRVGELARRNEIPHTPFYGAIDATPLFLIVLERYVAWTGDLALFHQLRENVERALAWIDRRLGPTGYLTYTSMVGTRLVNQGWKDSGDAIVNEDGSLARPPIALVEVQGYVYRAWGAIADLYARAGEPERAQDLRHLAERLQTRFNQDFWSDKLGTYLLALQADGAPVEVVASNAGHALWAGIADPEKATRVRERLMHPDMNSGWGIRTLSREARRYNPVSYHLGTVWPHDTALIASGFRRYGADPDALTLFRGLFDAATLFTHYRVPELFSGFSRAEYGEPVHYPVACHPQAWSAGALPMLLMDLLGLTPDGATGQLTLHRPALPDFLRWVQVNGLHIGPHRVSWRLNHVDGQWQLEVLEGGGKVALEP